MAVIKVVNAPIKYGLRHGHSFTKGVGRPRNRSLGSTTYSVPTGFQIRPR